MKTIISNKSFFKTSVKSLTIAGVFLSVVLFMSCSNEATIDELAADDTALIEQIESSSKTTVSVTSLPTAANTAFNGDLADSFVESVQLAQGFGYKVALITDNVSKSELKSNVYFSLSGKQLNDKDEHRNARRRECFNFVFPIDFIMPDNSSITLTSKEDWVLIKEWYQANPTVKTRPTFVFPINITLKDGTTQTILNQEELLVLKDSCRKNRDERKCVELVLPVSFTMPDANVITVNVREDFKLLREWHKANPTIKERGTLIFPVDVTFKDGTTTTIASELALRVANNSCKN